MKAQIGQMLAEMLGMDGAGTQRPGLVQRAHMLLVVVRHHHAVRPASISGAMTFQSAASQPISNTLGAIDEKLNQKA
jgi:hypothetical protein